MLLRRKASANPLRPARDNAWYEALVRLMSMRRGLYHLDSNERWSFYDIVSAINQTRGNPWEVNSDDSFTYDQRLMDIRLAVRPLIERLPMLA